MKRPMSRLYGASPARSDLAWVWAGTLLTFVLSSLFELHERLAKAAIHF